MNCDKYTEWLSAALDGELTAEQRRELDAHLAHCPDCAALFELLSANSRAMRELNCQLPEGLHDRMMNNLPPQEAPRPKKVIHWRRWGALAACLAVVIAVGAFARFGFSGGSMAPATAEMADPGSESPMEPNAIAAEGYNFQAASKTDDAAYSGETASAAPESVDPVPSATSEFSPDASAPEAEPSDNSGRFGERTPVASAAPGVSLPPMIGELTGIALPNVQYIRAAYGYTPAPSAVVISSADSLADYLKGFGTNRFDGDGNPVPIAALAALPETYTEDFFENHCLVAVVVESGSGSTRYEALSVQNGTVTIRTIVPEAGTCDMAAWLILIELDEMLDDGSTLTVTFTH